MKPEFKSALNKLRTPYKCPELVVEPSCKKGKFDSHSVDGAFVFEEDDQFYMTYIGWDAIGYRTGLATSDDLVHWKKKGLIIDRGPKGSPTEFNAAMTWIARSNDLLGECFLKTMKGKYVGTYHAYPEPGNEQGSASIGICWSRDLRHWELDEPFLHAEDGAPWERGGLYKSCLLEDNGTWYLFYNAKNSLNGPWIEQMGAVVSTDLKNWKRLDENPVVRIGPQGSFDDIFASEPCIYKVGDVWALFYFGNCSDGHARDSVAFSDDLIHWEKSNEVLIDVGPEGTIDSRHAHKPAMFYKDKQMYHYYTAAADYPGKRLGEIKHGETRGIALAVSQL